MDTEPREQDDRNARPRGSSGVRLRDYDNAWFGRGRPWPIEALWLLVEALLVRSWVPGSAHRRLVLRWFGARIGKRVSIKPGVRVKFPWRLEVGDDSWIGEGVWIDNLETVSIGANCCISQGAYICTGSHDWSSPTFGLITKPVRIEDCAWIAARAVVGPGVVVGEGAVLSLAAMASADLLPWGIYAGVPASLVAQRRVGTGRAPAAR